MPVYVFFPRGGSVADVMSVRSNVRLCLILKLTAMNNKYLYGLTRSVFVIAKVTHPQVRQARVQRVDFLSVVGIRVCLHLQVLLQHGSIICHNLISESLKYR